MERRHTGKRLVGAKSTPLCGIVPDKLFQLQSGRLLISAHFKNRDTGKLKQHLWYSDNNGDNWSERVIIASDSRYNLCEDPILECRDGTQVAFLRENSGMGLDCFQAFYRNGGVTVTGGEPMMQMDFLIELFRDLKRNHIHTCIDSSGIMFTPHSERFMTCLLYTSRCV